MRERAVYLLDAEPELAEALDRDTLAHARPYAVARVVGVPAGRWDPADSHDASASDIGLLVLDGLAIRNIEVAGRAATEMLGSGDLLRPWQPEDDVTSLPVAVDWTVLASLRLAVLDSRFAVVAGRWPPLMAAIVDRALRRSRTLVVQHAISQVTGLETRLLLVLWDLAHRWGYVSPEGVVLRLNLTHEILARLVAARRPSVTTALRGLEDRNLLARQPDGRWVLHGDPPEILDPGSSGSATGAPAPRAG